MDAKEFVYCDQYKLKIEEEEERRRRRRRRRRKKKKKRVHEPKIQREEMEK